MKSYSQSAQDLFVCSVLKKKYNGTFLEIGSNHPINNNNTYLFENMYNWRGLMVEYDSSFLDLYKEHRPNSLYEIKDARKVDYRSILDANFPTNIDYLTFDLDVDNKSTLDTLILLNDTVFDKYKFASITFEHDIYTGNYFDTQSISRKIFNERGYVLVFENVSLFWAGGFKPYEDWYVHPDLVDMDYINSIKRSGNITTDEIKQILNPA
jgi:hypothetical protein